METTHALLVQVYQETDFVPKQMAVYRSHGIGARFHTGTSGPDCGARFLYWEVNLYPVQQPEQTITDMTYSSFASMHVNE